MFVFETCKIDRKNFKSYYFTGLKKELTLTRPEDIPRYFKKLEKLSEKYYLAGFFSYELGYFLEDIFNYKKEDKFPLAFFGVYEQPAVYDHLKDKWEAGNFRYPPRHKFKAKNLKLNMSRPEYVEKILKIKEHIRAGNIYQANFTLKYKFDFKGDPLSFYRDLKLRQKAGYNVFMEAGNFRILSFSPELFFKKEERSLNVKPMKGTVKRGKNIWGDREKKEFLENDPKNRAENVMIVDLLRNDMGRISMPGSVKVEKLFEVEKFRTLFQMTSTVKSRLEKGTKIFDIIKALFPSGSVTGAPKIKSMQILSRLEKEERKIYCGALGFFGPGGKAKFNVPIRTVLIEDNSARMGVGGGIVYDSKPEQEYEECKTKARFLTGGYGEDFKLIETLLYDGKLKDVSAHLKRMKNSADYFEFKFNEDKIKEDLRRTISGLDGGKYKVRILVDRAGKIKTECNSYRDIQNYKIKFSKVNTDPENIFLYHKTTIRKIYDKELNKARGQGFYDIIFCNKKGQVTEGAITNIYLEKNGVKYTPPVNSGLLNGTLRDKLVKRGEVKEKVLYPEDVKDADEVFLSNSVIGLKKVRFSGCKEA
ncbi:MAG: aminodeoxychorismate synthase component I [Elusimicrobiota bacterium]